MRTKLLVIGLVSVLPAQATTRALRLLESSAHKYAEIGSYESSATASRPLPGGLTIRWQLKFGYAAPRMTPPDLPVPMLPQVVRTQFLGAFDQQGTLVKTNLSFYAPGPAFQFERIAWRLKHAKVTGTETVNTYRCDIIEVQYEAASQNPSGSSERYWIDPVTKTIWKMQFSEPDPLSKSGELARWTVVWNSWTENQTPPSWLVDFARFIEGKERTALIGSQSPDITGRSEMGKSFRLSSLKGKIVVIDFWATWCGPCVEEMASLERLNESLLGRPVEIWSVTEDKPETVRRWMEERKRTLPTVTIPRDTAFRSYGIDSLPEVAIIDQKGRVVHQWAGLKSEKDIRQAIEALLPQ